MERRALTLSTRTRVAVSPVTWEWTASQARFRRFSAIDYIPMKLYDNLWQLFINWGKRTPSVLRDIFQCVHDGLAKCIPPGMLFVFVFEFLISCVSASNTALITYAVMKIIGSKRHVVPRNIYGIFSIGCLLLFCSCCPYCQGWSWPWFLSLFFVFSFLSSLFSHCVLYHQSPTLSFVVALRVYTRHECYWML